MINSIFNDIDSIHSKYCIHWHQCINAVFLSHNYYRLVDGPEYGQLIGRFSDGTVTKEDVYLINSRSIDDNKGNGGTVTLSKEGTSCMYYICERNI